MDIASFIRLVVSMATKLSKKEELLSAYQRRFGVFCAVILGVKVVLICHSSGSLHKTLARGLRTRGPLFIPQSQQFYFYSFGP